MYRAKNGFILRDATTPGGWTIQSPQDIITALLSFPAFETVYTDFIWEAIAQALQERKEYENITDLAEFLTDNFI